MPSPPNVSVGGPSAVAVPTGLTWQPGNDRYLYLQWNSVGTGYRYNIYASLANPVHFTDTENTSPVSDTRVTWSLPHIPAKNFLFVVKAVDPQGRESAPSNMIEIDLP